MLVLEERRGENRSTRRKTSRSRVENQQTQPTYDAESGNRTQATLVGGECSHHCAIHATPAVCRKRNSKFLYCSFLRVSEGFEIELQIAFLFLFSQSSFSNGGHLFAAVHGNVIQLYSSTTFENVGNLKGHNGKVFY